MAATILACTASSSRAFVPVARKVTGRNLHRLDMSMALDSRQLRFYGGGLDTLDPPFTASFSADELPERISSASIRRRPNTRTMGMVLLLI